MNRVLSLSIIAIAATTLSGCVSGTPEFASMEGGKVQPVVLEKAKAVCRMRVREREDAAYMQGSYPNMEAVIADSHDCFMAQGIILKGWRQDNGKLTKLPLKPMTKMAERSLVVAER